MAKPYPAIALPLFARALTEEIGIRFRISGMPREQFRAILYETRKASADPTLQELIIFAPAAPHDDEIWIARKTVELDV